MIEWILLAALIGLFVLAICVTVVVYGSRQQVHCDSEDQYRRIRQDKEDGMRVNIKPEQK